MAHQLIAAAVVMPVGNRQSGRQPREQPRIGQLQQQMKVIAEQAIVIEAEIEPLAIPVQPDEELGSILIIVEDGFAGVAAIEDVKAGGRREQRAASGTRHGFASASSRPALVGCRAKLAWKQFTARSAKTQEGRARIIS